MARVILGPGLRKWLLRTENFNLAEAAEYLGVSQRHLKDLCRERRIVFTKPHYRAFSFRKEDLDRWLAVYRMHAR